MLVSRAAALHRRVVLAGTVAGCLFAAAACGSSAGSTAAGKSGSIKVLQVVAGENFWGNIAAQIGGAQVNVTSIITNPDTDPHEYETNPADAAAISRATVVIENGVGYDDFLSKELSAAGGHKQVLDVQKLVGARGSDVNPHLWYSPTFVTQTATAIERQFAADEPAAASTLQANLGTFLTAYQPYIQTIAQIRAKYAGTAIAYTERVPGYLVEAAGLHLGTPVGFSQAVEDGTDPTPWDTAAFNAAIVGHTVKVLLYNAQVVDDQTTKLKQQALSAGIPIVGVSETIPSQYQSFQAWQIAQARQLLTALGG